MGLNVTSKGSGEFEIAPIGNQIARIYGLIDLGTQITSYQGVQKTTDQIRILFELLDETRMSDGKPFTIATKFTASLSDNANLRKMLVSLRGKDFTQEEADNFDLKKIVGAYCQASIEHNIDSQNRTWAGISNKGISVMPLHGSMKKPEPVNENVIFDFNDPGYMDVWNVLPKWIQNEISKAGQWNNETPESNRQSEATPEQIRATQAAFEDDVPF